MQLPEGTASTYVLCAAWFGWELLLLGALAQFKTSAELKERVSRRTFQRLSDLNPYLGGLYGSWPYDDLVKDLEALLRLKWKVDKAAYVHTMLRRRELLVSVARYVACAELLAAALLAGLYYLLQDPVPIQLPAIVAFSAGTAVVLIIMLTATHLETRIKTGEDLS